MSTPKDNIRMKREGDANPTLQPPPKKKYFGLTQDNGSSTSVSIQEDMVLEFQKKAMLAKLEERRLEVNTLNQRIKELEEKEKIHIQNLSVVGRSRNQLKENLKLILARLNPSDSSVKAEILPFERSHSLESLLKSKGEENIDASLRESSDELLTILSQVVDAILRERSYSEQITKMLQEKSDPSSQMEALTQLTAKTKKDLISSQTLIDDLQNQRDTLVSQIDVLGDANVSLQHKINDLQGQLLDLKDEIANRDRKIFKMQIQHKEELENCRRQTVSSPTIQPPAIKKEESPPADSSISELKEENQSNLERIKKLEFEKLELLKEIQNLKREVDLVPHEKIVKSPPYLFLEQQLSSTAGELELLRSKYERLVGEFEASRNFLRTFKDRSDAATTSRQALLETKLREAELTIAKLTAENSKEIKDPQELLSSSNKVINEQQQLLTLKENEVKKLKKELEQSKEEAKEHKKASLKSSDELKELRLLVKDYQKKMEDYKVYRKKWEEKDRLGPESADKERKFLREENHKLRASLDRLEDDARKMREIEKINRDLKSELDSQTKEKEVLISEIEVIGGHFEDMQEQNVRLLQQLSEKEDILSKLMSEQMRSQSLHKKYAEEKALLLVQISKLEEKFSAQQGVLAKLENKNALFQEYQKKTTEELRLLSASSELLKRSAQSNSQLAHELKAKLEKVEKDFDDTKKKHDEKVLNAERLTQLNSKLEEEIKAFKKRYQIVTSKGEGKAFDTLREEQLKHLKQKLTCHICNENEKSVVIARCFHTFCRPCVETNLSKRSRKCPGCGKPFAETDVKDIWL